MPRAALCDTHTNAAVQGCISASSTASSESGMGQQHFREAIWKQELKKRCSDLLSFHLLYVCHTCICSFVWDNEGIFWLLPNSPTAAYLQSQSAGHEQLISRLNGTAFIASRFPSLPSQAAISYPYSSWAKLFYYEIAQPGLGLFLPSRQPCKKDLGQPLLRGPASEKSSTAKHRAWGARGLLGKEVPIGDATKQGEPTSTCSDAQMGLRAEEEEEDLGLAAAGDTCTRDRMGTVQLRKEWEEARKTWVPCCTSTALAQH